MQWAQLYSARRSGDAGDKVLYPDPLRTAYLQDYDRIVFSSAFRRLQNKTQVFPLPGPVFVHNRLTHSLEVASVGRSLGREVGMKIAELHAGDEQFRDFYRYELGTVISAACLAHDIGNPPFGHSGEDAIRSYFTELDDATARLLQDELSYNQLRDFQKFEGNSNAFRILTHNFNEAGRGGYKLTHTTLASIVKYPCTSAEGFNKASGKISCKKSGFFDSELSTYEALSADLGIPKKEGFDHVYARHPFVFLTEAADDICYRVIDLEDAHRLGITSFEKIKELFLPFFKEEAGYNDYQRVSSRMDAINDPNQKVQYLRAVWIGLMVRRISALYMEKETELLSGTLEQSLMDLLPGNYQELLDAVNEYSYKNIYNYKPVVEIEITGYHIIGALLQEFISAVLEPKRTRSMKLLQLISRQFSVGNQSLYYDLQSVVDYISGMTDLYAIDLYRKMTGISVREL